MIISFRGKNAFLSNFHPCRVEYKGIVYPSAEHAYQAQKTKDEATRQIIAGLDKPGQAKRAGGKNGIIRDYDHDRWEGVKVRVMREVLREKFRDPDLREMLLATGHEELIEGNTWGDTFWGVCRGEGQNKLGQLLMEIRAEIVKVYSMNELT